MKDAPPARRRRSTIERLYLWACERLYNEFAWAYDPVSWLVSAGRWGAWRQLALGHLPPGRVLEVGFGTGELLSALAQQGRQVYGLELSPAMQTIAGRKLRSRRLAGSVLRVRGLAQRLPFPDCSFDALVATFPAQYVFDPVALREFARVLRAPAGPSSGGRLVIAGLEVSIDNPRLARLVPLFYDQPDARAPAYWQNLLAAAGFHSWAVREGRGGAHVLVVVAERGAKE